MKQLLLLSAVLSCASAQAWECKHERDIDQVLDLSGSSHLSVLAGAGDLEITGKNGLSEARVLGKVCASKVKLLDRAAVHTEGGANASVSVSLPEIEDSWSFLRNDYVYIDLVIEVPSDLTIDVRDSSGDLAIAGTGPVSVRDSSGDIEIEKVTGAVVINDSSGDIDLSDIAGDVTIQQDSSGDIYGRTIQGSVLVENDSSGDIRFRDVRDNYVVERDSSGDIVADTVGGDFRVDRDGSGDIRVSGVSGTVDIPEES